MNDQTFTVLIPTLNRSGTLGDTLESCVRQEDKNFKIVVSDNHSDDETRAIVENFSQRDSRVSLISPPSKLAMAQHWDWAIQELPEGFFMVLGSDDALVPGAVDRARECVKKYEGIKAVVGSWASYHYPNIGSGTDGELGFHVTPDVKIRNGSEWLTNLASGLCGPDELPMPYAMAFVHTDGIRQIVERSGRLISSSCPDYFLATALAALTEKFVYLRQPLAISGVSSNSNGLLCLNPSDSSSIGRGAKFVREGDETWDSSIPYVANWHIILGETILKAGNVGLFGSEVEIRWDRLAAQAYHEVGMQDWSDRDSRFLFSDLVKLAGATGHPDLFSGVDGLDSPSRGELSQFAFDGWLGEERELNFDSLQYGVRNVADAACLVGVFLTGAEQEPHRLDYNTTSSDEIAYSVIGRLLDTQTELRRQNKTLRKNQSHLEASGKRLEEIGGQVSELAGGFVQMQSTRWGAIVGRLLMKFLGSKPGEVIRSLNQIARRLEREKRHIEKLADKESSCTSQK